jgi:hypothetical protein
VSKPKAPARRGPKTSAGRLAVRTNATRHGIRSVNPIVNAYEKPKDWEAHRQAIIDSLAPEGGIEQALAERVALCSWRLNRVIVYESERIDQAQERVLEEEEKDRAEKLRFSILYRSEVEDILAGTPFEDEIDLDKERISEFGVKLLSPPDWPLEAAKNTRRDYQSLLKVYSPNGSPEDTIEFLQGRAILERAAEHAVEYTHLHEEKREGGTEERTTEEMRQEVLALQERLEERLEEAEPDKESFTVTELRERIRELAEAAGVPEMPEPYGYTPLTGLLEKMHSVARYRLEAAQEQAAKVEEKLVSRRRSHILPDREDLEKIGRYEAHLSRQMYQALHELEARQEKRAGGKAPLARVDLQGLPET